MLGKINGIFGPEKSGKSRVICWMMAGLYSNDEPKLGFRRDTAPEKWLYLAGEETIEDVTARIASYIDFMGGGGPPPIHFINAAGMRLDQQRKRLELEKYLVTHNYDGLVIEPLRRVHSGDEDNNTAMAPVMNDLRRWSNAFGITTLLCHHTGKLNEFADVNRIATWSRGATDIAAILDCAMFVEERARVPGKRIMRLLRAGRFPPVAPCYLDDHGDPSEGGLGFKGVKV